MDGIFNLCKQWPFFTFGAAAPFLLGTENPRYFVNQLDLNQCLKSPPMFQLSIDQIYIPFFRLEPEGGFVIQLFFALMKLFSVVNSYFLILFIHIILHGLEYLIHILIHSSHLTVLRSIIDTSFHE